MHIDLYRAFHLDPRAPSAELAHRLTDQLNRTAPADARLIEQIDTARTILGDPRRRALYDRHLANPAAPPITPEVLAALAGRQLAGQPPQTTFRQVLDSRQSPVPRRRRIGRKALAGAVAGVVVLLVVVIAAVVGGTTTSSSKCADVVFIGAAGSGQRSEAKVSTADGMGEFVDETYKNLLNDANDAGKSVEKRPVDYPAAAVSTIVSDPQVFKDSIDAGVSTTTRMINDAVGKCAESKIVVAGYSQGAMVVHRSLQAVDPHDSVIGVLIADGDRQPSDPSVIFKGDAADYTGIAYTELGASILETGTATAFNTAWRGRLLSWCVQGDTVCSNKPGAIDWGVGPLLHIRAYDPTEWRAFLKKKALG